jgi:prepilin-type N-terminal cleavage/methylation domain-containing protein
MRRHHGFTLIELLIVITILAILFAILFPVFLTAKMTAVRTVCLSNLKQLGAAVQIYTQDYDDYFPFCAGTEQRGSWRHPQFPDGTAATCFRFVMMPYIKSAPVFECPADSGTPGFGFSTETPLYRLIGTSYLWNVMRRENTLISWVNGMPVGAVDNPAETQILWDYGYNWHFERTTEAIWRVTPNWQQNTLFADGHAKVLRLREIMNLPGNPYK